MESTEPAGVDIYLSNLAAGDTAILPGDPTPRHITRVWFVMKSRNRMVQVEEGPTGRDHIYTFHAYDTRKATLIERPGYGPFGREYKAGDKVYYRFGNRDNEFGVVVGFSENPLDPSDRAYEIRSATMTGYADSTSMRYVDQPAYAIGQRWHSVASGRYVEILGVDEIGLICTARLEDTGTIADFVLAAPHWELVDEAPAA